MRKLKITEMILMTAAVLSIILLVSPLLNYIEFYKALEKLSLQVSNFSFSIAEDKILIASNFSVVNPTSHTGLRLVHLGYGIYFKSDDEFTALTGGETWYGDPSPPINPHSNITSKYSVSLDIDQEPARVTLATLSTQRGIEWMITSYVLIETFTGRMHVDLEPVSFTA